MPRIPLRDPPRGREDRPTLVWECARAWARETSPTGPSWTRARLLRDLQMGIKVCPVIKNDACGPAWKVDRFRRNTVFFPFRWIFFLISKHEMIDMWWKNLMSFSNCENSMLKRIFQKTKVWKLAKINLSFYEAQRGLLCCYQKWWHLNTGENKMKWIGSTGNLRCRWSENWDCQHSDPNRFSKPGFSLSVSSTTRTLNGRRIVPRSHPASPKDARTVADVAVCSSPWSPSAVRFGCSSAPKNTWSITWNKFVVRARKAIAKILFCPYSGAAGRTHGEVQNPSYNEHYHMIILIIRV
jgi:hypothetical protein